MTARQAPWQVAIAARCSLILLAAAMLLVPGSAQASAGPVLAGSVSDSATLPGADSVAVAGSYAYVTDYYAGKLSAIDVSLPSAPLIAGSSEASPELKNGDTVNIAGGYAFVVSKNRNGAQGSEINDDGTGNSLTILDIHTNPAEPKVVGAVHSSTSLFGAYGIAVSGNYAYVAAQGCITLTKEQPCPDPSVGNDLDVIEIAGPEAPKIVATLNAEPLAFDHVTSVAISGSYAYLTASYKNRLTVVDIANPESPQLVTSLNDPTHFTFPVDVAIGGSYAYVISQKSNGPLAVVDIGNPQEPKVVGSLANAALAGGYRIRVRGKMAYISASENAGVAVIDISDPPSPRLLASYSDQEHLHSTTGLDLDPTGGYVLATSTNLSSQKQEHGAFPPYPLQPEGPVVDGTVSVIALDPESIEATISPGSEPANPTTQTSASFTFSVNDAVATVQCRLDSGSWTQCNTPTGQSYTPLSTGSHSFQVQATDSAGNTNTATYGWTVTTQPSNTALPTITGSAEQGQLLTASAGAWSGYPAPALQYQWKRCIASGGSCVPIVGASEPTYTAAAADVGSTLVVVVTATNVAGSSSAESAATAIVVAPPAGGGGGSGGSGSGGGGSGGSGSGGAPPEATPTTAQLQVALLGALLPGGKAARIASVRKHHSYLTTFAAPAGGEVSISWYELPKGAHLAGAKPILVASARATVTGKGVVKLTLKLTAQGRRLLAHARQIKLTGRGVFTSKGRAAVTVVKPFALR